ncbi:signal peptidase II [Ralstonia pickettii]|uniref:signal peptidase II n=1 Tax=Ralstonia pickettii TaxID=329 RepID=UPI003F67DFB2
MRTSGALTPPAPRFAARLPRCACPGGCLPRRNPRPVAHGIGLSLVASVWLAHMLRKRLSRMEALAYSLILGGAAGNLADRIWRGQVVDFLELHWTQLHWPAFNLADVAISSGAYLLLLAVVMNRAPSVTECLSG